MFLVDLDKPRRGPDARFFSNAFTGGRAKVWERAVSLTQPARDTLAVLGHPTDKLFIAVTLTNRSTHPTGLFRTDWAHFGGLTDAWNQSVEVTGDNGRPLRVTLSRLRLSEQVLNEKSSQNTQAMSENVYRLRDPQTHAKARKVVLQGQTDALEHAPGDRSDANDHQIRTSRCPHRPDQPRPKARSGTGQRCTAGARPA